MNRPRIALIMALACTTANAQQAPASSAIPDKPELLRRIALYEAAARDARTSHIPDAGQVKIYVQLGALYEDVAMYLKSEDAMRHAITLLQQGPKPQLADEMGELGVLYIAMGNLRQAEKEQTEALRIRESVGDSLGIAQTWIDLADLYIQQKHYKKALDYAQRAIKVLGDDPKVDPDDRIAVRRTLAFALCGTGACGQAIPLLKDALEIAKSSYGADSLQEGVGYYLLGRASWKNGDMQDASAWMERGTARMKVDLGWGQTIYVNAMSEYASFLRERGQMEAAASAQREVRQAQSVVDVHSFTARP